MVTRDLALVLLKDGAFFVLWEFLYFIDCLNHAEFERKILCLETGFVSTGSTGGKGEESKMAINETTDNGIQKGITMQNGEMCKVQKEEVQKEVQKEEVQKERLQKEKNEGEKAAEGKQQEDVSQARPEITEQQLQELVRHQMRVIKKGAVSLVGEEELEGKIRTSILTKKPLTVKFGMDPSAPDLHLGHAVALRKLKQLQDLGHQIVIVIGDFTARIGDPTGKSKGRRAMSDKEVLINAQTYQEQIFHILDRGKTQVRYNGEWLELLGLNEVLELASTITVARMLERDDFENRFSHNVPIGLHEFFYPLMQAYDSVALKADIELGGTDQTFNILMGRSLQKDRGMDPQAALFMPILEGTDGVEKMSKSLGNYIGIHEAANIMFQKVMQIPDSLIIRYFELATDILPEELDVIKEQLAGGCNPRDIKRILARTITALYHTDTETDEAEQFFEEAFTQKKIPDKIDTLQVTAESSTLFDCIAPLVRSGLVSSGGEFRRLLKQGGIQKNGERTSQLEEHIKNGDVLRIGRKKFIRLEIL